MKRYDEPDLPLGLQLAARIVEYDGAKAMGTKAESAPSDRQYLINNLGFRGPAFLPRKPNGVKRIIFIGGSSVFDMYRTDQSADDAQDWPHIAQRILKEKGYNNVEIINAGIPGFTSFDSFELLHSRLWIYQPDFVVFYEAWNDIKYFRKVNPEHPFIPPPRGSGKDSNPFTHYQAWWDRLLSYSQLYVKFRNQYYTRKFRVGTEGLVPEGSYQNSYSSYGLEQYKLNVELIVDLCRNIKATPILLTQATLVSPLNSEEDRKLISYQYQQLTPSALLRAFDDAYAVIRSVATGKHLPFLDLAKELNGRREFFEDHVHLSETGSREVAKRVADFLVRYLGDPLQVRRPTETTKSLGIGRGNPTRRFPNATGAFN